MAQILGVGTTHSPQFLGPSTGYYGMDTALLNNPIVSEHMRDVKNWPQGAQDEWNNRIEAAAIHQQAFKEAFRKVRARIDEFNPDVIIMWGDDQSENFLEDVVPPFCIEAHEGWDSPRHLPENNIWGEPVDKKFAWKGAPELAKKLATELLNRGFPIPYSLKNAHLPEGKLSHAFSNTLMYLDVDRTSEVHYPIIPIHMNAYGRFMAVSGGYTGHLDPNLGSVPRDEREQFYGPPGPSPKSCFELGQMVREIVDEWPLKVVLMASSSWSHSFLTAKTEWLFPDRETDYHHMEQLRDGEYNQWADLNNPEVEAAGGHEWKNWICLAGALTKNDRTAKPVMVDYQESWVLNSNKTWCYFEPEALAAQ